MTDTNLSAFIQTSLAQGKSKEDIYRDLMAQGFTVDVIQNGFDSLIAINNENNEKVETPKRTSHVIATIGAILVGAGIFTFVASNWQLMSRPMKIFIILVSMVVSYMIGWYLKEKQGLHKTGGAFILLGSIIYGAGIFLVAQMFNIRTNWPDGFILWMLGTIAMALAIESYGLLYLSIPLGIIALVGHPFDMFNSFGSSPFLLTSTFLLIITTFVTGISALFIRKKMPVEPRDFY